MLSIRHLPWGLLLLGVLFGQTYVPDHLLVKLQPGVSRGELAASLDAKRFEIEKLLVRRLQIYLVRIKDDQLSAEAALPLIRSNPFVEKAQLDHYLTMRQTIPNDPNFTQQWNMHNTGQSGGTVDADIDGPEAWDLTQGGVNPLGDTIVVAIVDGGMMLTHPDLVPNLWTNYNEIPGNGVDDDNNGYIDDIHGWNAYNSDGNIPSSGHGTHVAGIVGAKGNNASQVTGVNWNVKLMAIAGSTSQTSVALEAYGYALDQRILYDSTGGQLGAFVVATNSSFGIDYADCNSGSYVFWNDMYNAMGQAGILSAAATMNNNSNVDVTGDVPTGCTSDWLIAVTNTTKYDTKNSGAAYGATSIDLGAPGTAILSTYTGGGTSILTGTSMASPHVAGAVGFMHAAMSYGFAQYYRNQPGDGALLIKQAILDGTDSLASLQGITVSGGRLNLYNSALIVSNTLASDSLDPNPVTNLQADTSVQYRITLTWNDPTHLFGGDTISPFIIDISRDGLFLNSVSAGVETYADLSLQGGQVYTYTLITRLIDNDSTSVPVSISVQVAGGECIPGDASHDGNVDVSDIIRMIRFVLGYAVPNDADLCTADVDYDGQITIADILLTVDIILGTNGREEITIPLQHP